MPQAWETGEPLTDLLGRVGGAFMPSFEQKYGDRLAQIDDITDPWLKAERIMSLAREADAAGYKARDRAKLYDRADRIIAGNLSMGTPEGRESAGALMDFFGRTGRESQLQGVNTLAEMVRRHAQTDTERQRQQLLGKQTTRTEAQTETERARKTRLEQGPVFAPAHPQRVNRLNPDTGEPEIVYVDPNTGKVTGTVGKPIPRAASTDTPLVLPGTKSAGGTGGTGGTGGAAAGWWPSWLPGGGSQAGTPGGSPTPVPTSKPPGPQSQAPVQAPNITVTARAPQPLQPLEDDALEYLRRLGYTDDMIRTAGYAVG